MRAGRLRYKITITRPGETTRNEIGEPVTTDTTVATPWADILDSKAVDENINGVQKIKTEILFLLRYRSDIDNTCKIVYSGNTYQIVNIKNRYGKNKEMEVTARG